MHLDAMLVFLSSPTDDFSVNYFLWCSKRVLLCIFQEQMGAQHDHRTMFLPSSPSRHCHPPVDSVSLPKAYPPYP